MTDETCQHAAGTSDAEPGRRAPPSAGVRPPSGAVRAGRFLLRPEGPAGHFRTSVHASPLFAGPSPACSPRSRPGSAPAGVDLVDVGAGRGELLAGVLAALPGRLRRPYAVERAPARPGRRAASSGGRTAPGAVGAALRQRVAGQRARGHRGGRPDGVTRLVRRTARTAGRRWASRCRARTPRGWRAGGRWAPGARRRSGGRGTRRGRGGRRAGRAGSRWPSTTRIRGGPAAVRFAERVSRRAGGRRRCRTGRCDITAHVALDACARGSGELT